MPDLEVPPNAYGVPENRWAFITIRSALETLFFLDETVLFELPQEARTTIDRSKSRYFGIAKYFGAIQISLDDFQKYARDLEKR